MKKNIFLCLFLFVSILNVGSLFFDGNVVFVWTKPLIVLMLIAHYITNTQHKSILFVFALLFCLMGDVLLLFVQHNELFFMLGLIAFLIGHILYIVTYRKHQKIGVGEELLSTQKIRFALPIILAGTGLIVILFPVLGSLKLPVMVYAIVLMIMAITALLRYGKTSPTSFWMVMLGASLFMISDSALAINKFLEPFPFASITVMITYISAQFFIVEGIMSHTLQGK